MPGFALVTCLQQNRKNTNHICGIKHIIQQIKEVCRKKSREDKLRENVKKINLEDETEILIITLPYDAQELAALSKRRFGEVSHFLACMVKENSLAGYIPSKQVMNACHLIPTMIGLLTNKAIFKALLICMLDEIYSTRGVKISDLDITIISGDNQEELFYTIRQILSFAKYVTVVCGDKDAIEEELNRIYDESGLAVGVTADVRSGIRGADVIINLGGLKEENLNSRVNTKAVVFNYSGMNSTKVTIDQVIINGIEIGCSKTLISRLGMDVFQSFHNNEIASILLSNKIYEELSDVVDDNNSVLMEKISQEFRNMGFYLAGFTGRRSVIKTRDILL